MATVESDGTLRLDDLPFAPGDRREVILLPHPPATAASILLAA